MSSSSHSAQGAQPGQVQGSALGASAQEAQPERRRDGKRRVAVAWGAQTLALFGVWMAFSGHTEIEFLLWGALAALAGTATTRRRKPRRTARRRGTGRIGAVRCA